MGEREIIASTFDGVLQVRRQSIEDGQMRETIVYDNEPCALSRAAHTAAPSPPAEFFHIGESEYRMTLFALPAVKLRAGDRVSICQRGEVFEGISSDTFSYSSHGVCVVTVQSRGNYD